MFNYFEEYEQSKNTDLFWTKKADALAWTKKFTTGHTGDFSSGHWFSDGELNACYNCIDRHIFRSSSHEEYLEEALQRYPSKHRTSGGHVTGTGHGSRGSIHNVSPPATGDKVGIIFDDNSGNSFRFTYPEMLENILIIGNILRKSLAKGDCVTIYMGMSPNAVFTMLACARLGIVHNVVFGGFSADSLRMRIEDSKSKMVITADLCRRGDKEIRFVDTVTEALKKGKDGSAKPLAGDRNLTADSGSGAPEDIGLLESFQVLVFNELRPLDGTDYIWFSEADQDSGFFPCVSVNSEHPLFYLYTSGSTGKPKGLVHSTGGYLTYANYTARAAFDIAETDVFCCTADVGWITGHTYAVYGPLSLGITTVLLEGLPNHPSYERYFRIVERYRITQLYTAPTTIRILKKHFETNLDVEPVYDIHAANNSQVGDAKDQTTPEQPHNESAVARACALSDKYDLSSLRLLGSVGEPLNEAAYSWFSRSFGNLHIVDCYWQTETGGIVICSFSNAKACKPECAGMAMPGIFPMVTDADPAVSPRSAGSIAKGSQKSNLGKIYITKSWPGIARTILNDTSRYITSYFGTGLYFTGDEGIMDENEDVWILGRADDVLNVSGHRISTAEVESAACTDAYVAEAAVAAQPHKIKGECIVLFVVLRSQKDPSHASGSSKPAPSPSSLATVIKEAISSKIAEDGNAEPAHVIEATGPLVSKALFECKQSEEQSIKDQISKTIYKRIGGLARPETILIVNGIPKTATGKILRRVLRNIILNKEMGDLSTCVNQEAIKDAEKMYRESLIQKN